MRRPRCIQATRPHAANPVTASGASGVPGMRLRVSLRTLAFHLGLIRCYNVPMSFTPNRDAAWQLLTEYTKGDSLLKHALAVEAAVRGYARMFNEDEEGWGVVALLHDFDYERWPSLDDHPFRGSEILRERGLSRVGDPRHPLARRLQRGAAGGAAREDAVCL